MDREWFGGFFAVLFVMTFATTTNHSCSWVRHQERRLSDD
jgi:hypothetical protein